MCVNINALGIKTFRKSQNRKCERSRRLKSFHQVAVRERKRERKGEGKRERESHSRSSGLVYTSLKVTFSWLNRLFFQTEY